MVRVTVFFIGPSAEEVSPFPLILRSRGRNSSILRLSFLTPTRRPARTGPPFDARVPGMSPQSPDARGTSIVAIAVMYRRMPVAETLRLR